MKKGNSILFPFVFMLLIVSFPAALFSLSLLLFGFIESFLSLSLSFLMSLSLQSEILLLLDSIHSFHLG